MIIFFLPQIYYLYGVLLLVFIILIIVTIFATILGTYMLLNAENHHWQWTSFLAGASIAIYIFLYSIYYYHVKTRISSFIQASIYFGSTLMLSLGLGILCGKFAASLSLSLSAAIVDISVSVGDFAFFFFFSSDYSMGIFSLVLVLTLIDCFCISDAGAVGYVASNLFVRWIYRNIKCEWIPPTGSDKNMYLSIVITHHIGYLGRKNLLQQDKLCKWEAFCLNYVYFSICKVESELKEKGKLM